MFSQTGATQRCVICNGTDFYNEAGFYFCSKCQTQNEDIREEVHEFQFDATTRLRKTKIKSAKSDKTDVVGWTSWELYNFALIGITNELIELGADPSIKLTILQLWTFYLSKLEVAFTSKTKKCVPKMARRYHKKDAEIIYGKIQQKKKKNKNRKSNTTASSMISSFVTDGSTSLRELNKSKKLLVASEYDKYLKSQASSDTDGFSSLNQSLYSLQSSTSQNSSNGIRIRFNKKAKLETKKVKVLSSKICRARRKNYQKNYVTTQYAAGPDVVTPLKLLAIVYLALRINNEDIYLSDMLRFSREGHLSYYKLDHLLPPDISLSKSDVNLLTQTTDITHKGLRRTAASIAKFLNINELPKPNFLNLIKRYCEDLELSRGILLYAERLFLSLPSIMNFSVKSSLIPNYEGRAIAYIIVVLKTLFGIDDTTEKEISRVIEKINRIASEKEFLTAKLFSFCEWQRYVEYRKRILSNEHFPTKLKYDPDSMGTTHLYIRFTELIKSKREVEREPPEITNYKQVISRNLVDAMYQCIDSLNDNSIPIKDVEVFPPSLTPLRSYMTQLKENPNYEIPSLLKTNFYDSKIGYMTMPDSLIELASQCGINLEVINHNLQYLEKIVPPFEQPKMPSLNELSKLVRVQCSTTDSNTKNQSENLLDYSHRNRMCKLKVNFDQLKYHTIICNKPLELDETLDLEEDSGFDQILPDGRLKICEDSNSEDESILCEPKNKNVIWSDDSCLLNKDFCKTYNIDLYLHEINSMSIKSKTLKKKYIRCRDSKGKFVKPSAKNLKKFGKSWQKKEFKRIKELPVSDSSEDEVVFKRNTKKKNSKCTNEIIDDNEIVELPVDYINLSDSDISILNDDNIANKENCQNTSINNNEILFRPYGNYWMYHCIFSRVKGTNFELFEKELPQNFLWLLNLCANIVEMSTEDLYEEICLIEASHLNILKSKKSKNDSDYSFHDCNSKLYINNIINKW